MKKIVDYLKMFLATAVFWIASAIMFIILAIVCVSIPAAICALGYVFIKWI